jgi:hypothetical protein
MTETNHLEATTILLALVAVAQPSVTVPATQSTVGEYSWLNPVR